jgi:UTP--glucose-1-phosphate uridylyltransferase
MASVRKAVIPAAGWGTRLLPATKAQPKEMLPVIDKPAIQYVVEEAAEAGIDDILVVTSRGKASIEDHFDRSPELEASLEQSGKFAELAAVRNLAELARIHSVRQGEPLGLGHAVSMARTYVGDEPFAVLLPDDLMVAGAEVLSGMVATHERYNASVIALKAFPLEEISAYGSVESQPIGEPATEDALVRVVDIVEKPKPEEAPSELAVLGRYVFTPDIFDAIDRTPPGVGNEIQLTDAIGLLLREHSVLGYVFTSGRLDVGKKLDYLRANVEFALDRPDLGDEFGSYLVEVVKRRGLG